MTYYPSESEIRELARQARCAAREIAGRAKQSDDPEAANWPLEYRLSREDYRVFMQLTRAYSRGEETHRPAAARYHELQAALRTWRAAGGNEETLQQ